MQLLQIHSSPMGEASISRHLTKEFVHRWLSANPQGTVISRDLTTSAIPVIDARWISANYAPKELRTQEQNDLLALSTIFTSELLEADEYVIGVPCHNWAPPSSLKLWADQIVRFGETISVTQSGPIGALHGKRVTFIITVGKAIRPGSTNAATSYVEPWLCAFFGYLGVKNMRSVIADGTVEIKNDKIDRATFLAPHEQAIRTLFAQALSQ